MAAADRIRTARRYGQRLGSVDYKAADVRVAADFASQVFSALPALAKQKMQELARRLPGLP